MTTVAPLTTASTARTPDYRAWSRLLPTLTEWSTRYSAAVLAWRRYRLGMTEREGGARKRRLTDDELRRLMDEEARAAEEAAALDEDDGAPLPPHAKVSLPNREE